MSKFKMLSGKRVNLVERAFNTPLELMINEMSEKELSYREMASVLNVSVGNIQVWLRKMNFGKAKRGARKQEVLGGKELKEKYSLSF